MDALRGSGTFMACIIPACCLAVVLSVAVVGGSEATHATQTDKTSPRELQNVIHYLKQEPETGTSDGSPNGHNDEREREGPSFLAPPTRHVTVRVGQTAALTCIVKHLANRQVSWIRGRDLHVLSSGQVTFSSDSRVSVTHLKDSWTLTIRYSQPRDAGSYSCQVNTQPPLASWYNLTVVEARANILGKETMYVQMGSTVSLECVIKEELVIPGLVLWYQDDRLVDRDSGRVKVVTIVGNVTTSTLTVAGATRHDSGNYSCWPSAGRPDNVIVHVIQGDPPAAMQHGNSATWVSTVLLVPVASLLTLLLLLLT